MTSIGFPCKFDKNVASIISLFLAPKPQKFLDWIDVNKLDWKVMSGRIDGSLLARYKHKIKYESFYRNTNAVELIEDFVRTNHVVDWKDISQNPTLIHILEKNKDKIDWKHLSYNENAVDLIKEFTCNMTINLEYIDLDGLCSNAKASDLIEKYINDSIFNINQINWIYVSAFSTTVEFLFQHLDRVDWKQASWNKNITLLLQKLKPKDLLHVLSKEMNWKSLSWNSNAAFYLYELYENNSEARSIIDKNVVISCLCENENGVPLLTKVTSNFKQNMNPICWEILSGNKNALDILQTVTMNFTKNVEEFVHWNQLCRNKNPKAIQIIEQNFSQIKFDVSCQRALCQNTCASNFLRKNPYPIDWFYFSLFQNVCETDQDKYNQIKMISTNFVYDL